MKIGTHFAYWGNTWNVNYVELCHRAKKCGLDVLEVGAGDLVNMSDAELEELRVTAKDLGLQISANLGPPKDKDICSADPTVHAAGVEFLCAILDQMVKIDCPILIGACYNHWPYDFVDTDKEALLARAVEGMKIVGDHADKLGLTIALEILNRFESCMINTLDEGIAFCERVGKKSVKLLLDTFHMNIEEVEDIPSVLRRGGDWVAHVHVGEANRMLPGTGHMPWDEIGQALRDINYDGKVVMEPFLLVGGEVGPAIKVWRDLSGGADADKMDEMMTNAVNFLRSKLNA
ncbi:MAG: sugar phosphate isomerase/epimerase [Clostridia bacterium]|nr:sugar phosphate isomerase/epimerase [Clostridia bacterium]